MERALRERGAELDDWMGQRLPVRFGAVEREWHAARDGCAAWVTDFRTWIAVTGDDRISFLQGMLSNDVKALVPGQGTYAAVLTQQGKIVADLRVYAAADRVWLDVLSHRADAVRAALERFIVADDVELGVEPGEQPLLSLSGPSAHAIIGEVVGRPEPAQPLAHWYVPFRANRLHIVAVSEHDGLGYLLAGRRDDAPALLEAVCAAGAVPAGMEALNVLRIEAGIPWYGIDMDEDVLLMELPLERAVSFTKGCYLGQEVVERVAARGHVNRKLTGLRVAEERVPPASAEVRAAGHTIGRVTSAIHSLALGQVVALAYVHRNQLAPGTAVSVVAPDYNADATVSTLPFSPAIP